jgi:RNA polymerase sigma-70 factor (ECF subfamily)
MEDQGLIQSARQGDVESFRQLFETHKQRIFAIAFRYAKNKQDAEDILQDTFIKAFQSLDKFHLEESSSFTSWLYRIGINSSIDHLRKNNKMRDKFFDSDHIDRISSHNDAHNPEHTIRLQDVREKLGAVLSTLTARQRMIFILRHYQQLTTEEIAEYMNCSQGSVKKQLFRAVSTVKGHFKSLITEKAYEVR